MNDKIIKSLEKIYLSIKDFPCNHCHKCCGPIIWFEPEDLLITMYMKKYNIKRIIWTKEEFEKNNMICPYLINDRCIIYPARPIVCRLQGNISELRCISTCQEIFISELELNNINKDFINLIKQTNGMNYFYSTLRRKSEEIS